MIQIIAGRYRGKKLPVLSQDTLRPTPNRVRETLFNWLMHEIPGSTCLDAFAGTGALGFEAISRGAAQVTMLEQDLQTFRQLDAVASVFQPAPHLLHQDTPQYLQHCTQSFDLIFLDPPFHSDLLNTCLQILAERSLLTTQGFVYVESDKPIPVPHTWQCHRMKKAGQVYYGLLQPARTDEKRALLC